MFIRESNPTIAGSENAACGRGGSFDVLKFAGRTLCKDCIALAGCSCAGHGGDSGE
jgi:hypothetical protein